MIDNIRIIDTNGFTPTADTVWRMVTLSCDSTMGTVSGGGLHADSTYATLRAMPLAGYRFVAWNDGDTLNPRNVFVVSDTAFTATFRQDGVGIKEWRVENGEWSVWPNPASGSVTIATDGPAVVTLLDVSGREVLRQALPAGGARVDISRLMQGVYFLRLEGSAVVKKLLVGSF